MVCRYNVCHIIIEGSFQSAEIGNWFTGPPMMEFLALLLPDDGIRKTITRKMVLGGLMELH